MDQLDKYLIYLNEEELLQELPIGQMAKAAGKAGAKSKGGIIKSLGGSLGVTAAFYALPLVLKGANMAFKSIFSKAHKACRALPKEDYSHCIRKYKLKAFSGQLAKLNDGKSKCQKGKDAEKCIRSLTPKIQAVQFKIKMFKQAIARGSQ